MSASKSSRARNARAQASAARGGNPAAGRANRGGTATRTGTAVRTGPVVKSAAATEAGTAVRTGRDGAATRNAAGRANGRALAPRTEQAPRGGMLAKVKGTLANLLSGGPAVPLWLRLTTFVLALAGLAASTYLTYAHFTQSTLAGCSETAGLVNCTKVTTSPQSYVFGIPVAVLGLAFYVFMVAIMSPWAWRATRREVHLIRIGSLIAGMGFVLYLLYAELFIIGSICLYCTSVHAITFVLFVLTMFAAAAWGLRPARSET